MTADPYPTNLAELDPEPIAPNPDAVTNRLTVAVNRLAQAIEQDTLARLHPVGSQPPQNAPGAPLAPLAALPPVQTVANTPACPYHGTAKVRPSTNGKGGFYCSAQPGIGQPNTNPKGYCTWHS